MTNEQLIILGNFIHDIYVKQKDNKNINAKFLYALKRNKDIITPYIATLYEKLNTQPDEELKQKFNEYNTERVKICTEYSEKDENDKPVIQDGNFRIVEEKHEEFETKMKELGERYPETIEFRKQQMLLERTTMMDIADLDFYHIKVDWLPEKDIIAPEFMDILHEIIEE